MAPDAHLLTLSWQAGVDLDLFVTGPDGETIYYGNRVARAGFRMLDEVTCKDIAHQPPPYHESVVIPAGAPGRYRVSVDFIKDCGTGVNEVTSRAVLQDHKAQTQISQNSIHVRRHELKTVAWEVEVK